VRPDMLRFGEVRLGSGAKWPDMVRSGSVSRGELGYGNAG